MRICSSTHGRGINENVQLDPWPGKQNFKSILLTTRLAHRRAPDKVQLASYNVSQHDLNARRAHGITSDRSSHHLTMWFRIIWTQDGLIAKPPKGSVLNRQCKATHTVGYWSRSAGSHWMHTSPYSREQLCPPGACQCRCNVFGVSQRRPCGPWTHLHTETAPYS